MVTKFADDTKNDSNLKTKRLQVKESGATYNLLEERQESGGIKDGLNGWAKVRQIAYNVGKRKHSHFSKKKRNNHFISMVRDYKVQDAWGSDVPVHEL